MASRAARSSSTSVRPGLPNGGTRLSIRRSSGGRQARRRRLLMQATCSLGGLAVAEGVLLPRRISVGVGSRARRPRGRLVGTSSSSEELRESSNSVWIGGSAGACDWLVGLVGSSGQRNGARRARLSLRVSGDGAGALTASRARSVAQGRFGAVMGPAAGSWASAGARRSRGTLVRVSLTDALAGVGVLAGTTASLRALAGVRRCNVRPSWASGALVGRRGAFRARSGLSRSSGGSSCSLGVAEARGGGVESCHRGLVPFRARPRVFARKARRTDC